MAASLFLLCLPSARAGDASPRKSAAASESRSKAEALLAEIEVSLAELEGLSSELEGMGKAYLAAPDLSDLAGPREALRRRIFESAVRTFESREVLNDTRKTLEARQGARILMGMADFKKKVPSGRRLKAAAEFALGMKGGAVEAVYDDVFGLRLALDRQRPRLAAILERMTADEAAFARERDARLRLKRLRMAWGGGLGLCLLALACALLCRRLRRDSAAPPGSIGSAP